MRSGRWPLASGELNPFSARALQVNVSFSCSLMCSCKGLLPQSSPSHLIHKEMTGKTIPTKDALGRPAHYIILYLCFLAPTALHGAEKLGELPTSRLSRGGNESCHGVSPRGPLASRTCEAPRRSREGGCAPARVRPVALSSSSSFHYIIFSCSEGRVGAGGLGSEEKFATFLHSFSPPHPRSALKKHC